MKSPTTTPPSAALAGISLGLRAAALLLVCGTSTTFAASTLWWDGNSTTVNGASDNSNTASQNWLSGGNWDNNATSAPLASWAAGDSAIFGGSAASQTVNAGALTVGNLTFGQGAQGAGTSGTAYTVNGGPVTLLNSTITANTPTVINASLVGTTGLISAGPATLTLGISNSYTGTTVINAGTVKITQANSYRYYKFTVVTNNGDGYNQIGELHFYAGGVWTAAIAGSASGSGTGEQLWSNANDNKGSSASFSKYGVSGVPYTITYDFGTAKAFTSYNWSTANDSTPARNPKRWTVSGSNDNSTWTTLDDRSTSDQASPSSTYTWAGTATPYVTATNAANEGSTNAYPLANPAISSLPAASPVQIASGATLDLNGCSQFVATLADSGASGGSIINSASAKPVFLTINTSTGSTTFGGVISDNTSSVSLQKNGAGTQIFTGANTYSGSTTLNAGALQLGAGGKVGTGPLTVNSGNFEINGQNQTVGKLSGTGGTLTNSAATDSTLTVSLPASTVGNFAGTLSTPGTGKLNLVFNSTAGGTASATSLANAANTFKGTITVNGTGFIDGLDPHGLLGINTDGALGDVSNPITLNNGGALTNMFNPNVGGGWPNHAAFTLPASRTITVTGIGGVIRTGYAGTDLCTINSTITGDGGLAKTDGGAVILGGSTSNTYAGVTTLGGSGKLLLSKTGGALAIPGNINLSSSAWNGQNSGIVLALDEQIADSAVLTWTNTSVGGATTNQSDSFFRPNGHTETIGGLVSAGNGGLAVIENRGSGDAASYGTGTVIINTTGSNSYSYNGNIRDIDGGSGGGAVAVIKTGTGTQIFSGSYVNSGATTVNGGVLRMNGTMSNSPVTVTGAGTLEGTGSFSSPITVQSGGILSPGSGGTGTLTATTAVTIASGGILSGSGTLNGAVNVATGGMLTGTGTVSGTVTVQSGGNLSPGTSGIGNLNTTGAVILSGNATLQINKSGSTLTCDTVTGFSNITYGGTLTIEATGDTPVLGDSFQLFIPGSGGSYGGSFANIVGLPALSGGLQWETTNLLGTGRITVVNYVSTPSFNPAAGGYIGSQSVTITSDSGSTIFYTTDGSTPTPSSASGISPISGILVPVDSMVTLQAFARKSGQADSPVATAVYHTVTTAKWNVDANGTWSDTANWINQVSPNSSGAPVDFTLPQTADAIVSLDGGRTAGSLTFGNTLGFTWTLQSTGDSILTLDTPSGTPSIATQDVNTTISAVIGGSQGLTKSGTGTLVLSGANVYSGTTAINGGVLSVNSLNGNGSSSGIGIGTDVSINGATLRYTGTGSVGGGFNRNIAVNSGGATLDSSNAAFWFTSGVISGPGSIIKTGSTQWISQGNNTYDGITYLNQAEIQMRNVNALGSTNGNTIVANGARLCAGGGLIGTINENVVINGDGGGNGALQSNDGGTNVTFAGNITLASDSSIGGGTNFAISGPISGNGALTKLNGTIITLSGGSSNTYAGTTTLGSFGKLILAKTGGTIAIPGNINLSSTAWNGNASGVVLAGDEQIADSSVVTWTTTAQGGGGQAASFLRINGHTETVGGLVSVGVPLSGWVENRGYTDTASYPNGKLIINATGSNTYTYNGGFRDMDQGTGGGTLALTKTGTGTQILNGGMPNTGATTVNGGTLEIDCASSSTATTVNTGGTLSGIGSVAGTLAINVGGTIAPGNGVGTFSSGATTLGGTYNCEINGSICDKLTVTGSLDITGSTLALTVIAAPSEQSYVIASCTGTLTGTFTTVTGKPSNYTLDYSGNQIALVKNAATPYSTWATSYGLDPLTDGAPEFDKDGDGQNNALEYALGGSPVSGSNNAKIYNLIADGDVDPDTTNEQLMTIAVRVGTPAFAGTPSPGASFEGVTYTIEGSTTLGSFPVGVTVVATVTPPAPNATPPAGYEYRTFSLDGSNGLTNKGFMRVKVEQ